jgi:hypothetical protein
MSFEPDDEPLGCNSGATDSTFIYAMKLVVAKWPFEMSGLFDFATFNSRKGL